MAKQIIDIGTSPNKGDGDPLRTAFTKINANFDELYAGIFADPEQLGSNLSPDTDAVYNLGASDKRWADVHISDFLFLNGQRIEATPGGAILVNGSGAREAVDIVGSLFGDDSTLLIDGINNSINLDGTISGDVVPDANEAYDLGSATRRFRDLYLSGSTIDLGGTTLSIVGGELQLGGVKIPTQVDLDTAVSTPTGDLQGSVFADDSTLLVDAVNGVIPWSVIDGAPSVPTFDQTLDTTDEVAFAAVSVGNLRVSPIGNGVELLNTTDDIIITAQDDFTVSTTTGDINLNTTAGSVGIDAAGGLLQIGGQNGVDISSANGDIELNAFDNTIIFSSPVVGLVGDITGSVFADDSTLLVDGVAGKIVGPVETAIITGATDLSLLGANTDSNGGGVVIAGGIGASGAGGNVTMTGGIGQAGSGGNATIVGGIGIGGNGGQAQLLGGNTNENADGGPVYVVAGTGATGGALLISGGVGITTAGGEVTIQGGNGPDGAGGDLRLWGGVGSGNTIIAGGTGGGDVTINGGAGTPGNHGDVIIGAGQFTNSVIVDKAVVTGDLTGSVFADDSTLLVDAVNGKLIGDVVTTSITNSRDIDIASEDDVAIITSAGNNNYEWFFNSGGYLSFPPNGELLFDGDAGITFSTVYDVAGSTAHIDIRDTGSTANLSIDNDAANGTIDITANGYVTIATDDDGTRYEFNFGADGSLTLPGAVVSTPDTSTGGADSSTATALDVTKTLQVLNSADGSDDWWSLADGTEGQIMHFVPGTGAGTNQHKVTIQNWRKWDSGAGVAGEWVVRNNLDWLPFKLDFAGNYWTGVATAIFTNGAWQTNNPWID